MGYSNEEGVEMPPLNTKKGIILTASPVTGIHIQYQLCECIKSPDNSFYNQEDAEANAFMFVVNPDVIPYELSCVLQDHGMLPDANINSTEGKEHGKAFLHKNAHFLTDYFYNRCREKDFTDKDLLEAL